jgi:hypothetical protein
MTNNAIQRLTLSLVLFCLIVFVLVGAFDIQSPGLYYDEALFVNAASGGVTDLFIHKRLAGIPIMLMPYIGALKSWLYFPIFQLFGIDFVTIRLPVVLLGALALGLTWRYVQQQFGTLPAALFILMAAVEPSVVFHSRLDWGPTVLMMVFRGGLLLALTNWFATGEKRYLMWALICVGLGVFDKLNFLWIATSAFAAGILVYPDRFLRGLVIEYKTALTWLGLGLLALVLFVAALNWLDVRLLKEIGVTDIGKRATIFLSLLGMTIQGAGVYNFVIKGEHQAFNSHTYALLAASVVAMWGLLAGIRGGKLSSRPLIYLVLVILFLGIQVFLTKKATGPHHFATFAPFWLIFLAVGLSNAVYALQLRRRMLASAMGVLFVALVMATSLRVDMAYLEGFKYTKINTHWDPAASAVLTSALEAHKDVELVVAVDWGIATNVQALSNNRLKVMDLWPLFNENLNEGQVNWIRTEFVEKGAAFVLHVAGREAFPATRLHFLETIRANGWPLRQVLTIKTADAQPYIEVYLPVVAQP